jgi:hypothetical protein
MSKALVDTTILADCLLKPSTKGQQAKAALKRFDVTELPVYAIKEFKAGALRGYIWLHNAMVSEGNLRTVLRIQGLSRSLHRNLTSTALEALAEAIGNYESLSDSQLIAKYGEAATGRAMQYDIYRLHVRSLVHRAWRKRREVTTSVVGPLECYPELDLYDDRHGLIEHNSYGCPSNIECSLAASLRANLPEVIVLANTVKEMPSSQEQKKRYHALHDIARSPRRQVTDKICRALGDAVFALFCPKDAVVLTTNLKDHRPLAQALGKDAESV